MSATLSRRPLRAPLFWWCSLPGLCPMPLGLECPSLAITSEPPCFGSASCPVSCAMPGFVFWVCDAWVSCATASSFPVPSPGEFPSFSLPVLLTFSRLYPRCASSHTLPVTTPISLPRVSRSTLHRAPCPVSCPTPVFCVRCVCGLRMEPVVSTQVIFSEFLLCLSLPVAHPFFFLS